MNGTEKKELGHATVVLAENHRPHTVFGGVHLVFSGDFFQLPPENHRVAVDPSYAELLRVLRTGCEDDVWRLTTVKYALKSRQCGASDSGRAAWAQLELRVGAALVKMGFMGFKMVKKGYMYYDPAYMTRVARRSLTKPHDMPSLVCMDCGGVCSGEGWSWTAAHQGEVPCCCTVDDPSRIFAVVETQARTSLHLHLFDYFPVFECKNCHIAVPASAGMFTTSQGGGGHCAACSSSDGPCGSDDLDLFN